MLARRQLRVTIWNEYVHERREPSVQAIYPDGMHAPIAEGIRRELGDAVTVRIATLEEPEHGLTEAALAETDVLTWWGHAAHDQVADEVVERVHARVLDGMGIVVCIRGITRRSSSASWVRPARCAGAPRRAASARSSGPSIPPTRSRPASRSRSSSRTTRCTASTSTSRLPTSSSS